MTNEERGGADIEQAVGCRDEKMGKPQEECQPAIGFENVERLSESQGPAFVPPPPILGSVCRTDEVFS